MYGGLYDLNWELWCLSPSSVLLQLSAVGRVRAFESALVHCWVCCSLTCQDINVKNVGGAVGLSRTQLGEGS